MPPPPTLPPAAQHPLSVVLLASDAAGYVQPVLAEWLGWLEKRGKVYELLLVDDGSADGTGDLAEQVAITSPCLRVLRHGERRGEGIALRTGLGLASHPLIFYTLCHPDYHPADLERMLDKPMSDEQPGKVIDHVHLMTAYRAGVPVPAVWRAVGWMWRLFCIVVFSFRPAPLPGWLGLRRYFGWLLVRTVFALRHHDVACPFRLLRREVLVRAPIQSSSSFAHVELLAKANFLGHVMAEEVPIDVRPGTYRGDLGQMWRDARRVFDRPDFGPPILPADGFAV